MPSTPRIQFTSGQDPEGLRTVQEVYGEQVRIGLAWFHAERVLGRPVHDFTLGEVVESILAPQKRTPVGAESADEMVGSDLFQESGANVSHTPEKIEAFANAMRDQGGWGAFPLVAGRLSTIEQHHIDRYRELETLGCAHELAYSRPLQAADLGRRYVQIENGHNRAYAARLLGLDIPVFDLNRDELKNEQTTAPRPT